MKNQKIEMTEFTDPVCTWCWGSEPILRKLKTRFRDQIKISFTMGGLVNDIRKFYDRANDIGGDPERSNKNIIKHWLKASERHGMPVKKQDFSLFTDEHPSSYPQNIAYKAAQMEDETLANVFLRRVREATAAEARQTNKQEVLIELANEAGLDVPSFIKSLEDDSAQQEFEEDRAKTREYGVRSFPSFLLKYGDKETMLQGYQTYDVLSAVVKKLSNGSIEEKEVEKSKEGIMDFINEFESVAPVEIKTAFELSDRKLNSIGEFLANHDKIQKVEAGNGCFFRITKKNISCNTVTGTCGS